ncbi:MAG: diacylglycerol kinase family protein [Pyrinomonadaceae bacterium]
MFPVKRALLILNRAAGTGHGDALAQKLSFLFKESLTEVSDIEVATVSDHRAVRSTASTFMDRSEDPALIIAGGGGGTLRAVIEGICGDDPLKPLPGPLRVRVGALRMGSGNVVAKELGVPRDPVEALRALMQNLASGQMTKCCVMRCEVWKSSGASDTYYATTLIGLGQFGRIPGDLQRWHSFAPDLHRSIARMLGIEAVTNIEYAIALLFRSISCAAVTAMTEAIQISFQEEHERMRLLSGAVMNFAIKHFPFQPGISIEDEAVCIYLVPAKGKFSALRQIYPKSVVAGARRIRLEKDQSLEIRLTDRKSVEFFLDEDPLTAFGRLRVGVAGSIAFVPGPDYQVKSGEGVSA